MSKRKIFYIISTVILTAGLLNIAFRGLKFGIDFKGGTEIVLQFDKAIDITEIRNDVATIGLGNVEVKTFGNETGVLLRTELQDLPQSIFPKLKTKLESEINTIIPNVPKKIIDESKNSIVFQFENYDTTNTITDKLIKMGFQAGLVSEEISNTQMMVRIGISDWLKDNLREKIKANSFTVLKEEKIGPKIGDELKRDALIAIFISLLGILIYLAFRFKFIFALGAVIALFHDVLITLGLYAILYGVIPGLNLEFDITVLAAFLLLIGYSVNDTVIVFDRIREMIKVHKTETLYNLMNMAINKTASRTVLTGSTTLLSCFILLLLGGDVIRAFSFTMTFGIITGTYSSVFIASAFVLDYAEKRKKKIEF
jgi:preprotein translocase SecF subunit